MSPQTIMVCRRSAARAQGASLILILAMAALLSAAAFAEPEAAAVRGNAIGSAVHPAPAAGGVQWGAAAADARSQTPVTAPAAAPEAPAATAAQAAPAAGKAPAAPPAPTAADAADKKPAAARPTGTVRAAAIVEPPAAMSDPSSAAPAAQQGADKDKEKDKASAASADKVAATARPTPDAPAAASKTVKPAAAAAAKPDAKATQRAAAAPARTSAGAEASTKGSATNPKAKAAPEHPTNTTHAAAAARDKAVANKPAAAPNATAAAKAAAPSADKARQSDDTLDPKASNSPAGNATAADAAAQERAPWDEPPARPAVSPVFVGGVSTDGSQLCTGPQSGGVAANIESAAFRRCAAGGSMAAAGMERWFTFVVDPSQGLFDFRLMMVATGGHAVMELWFPGEEPTEAPPRFTATNLLIAPMTQESFIRVQSSAVGLNAGTYAVRVASERGAPRLTVSLAVTPSRVRLAEGDRAALGRVVADCCAGDAARAAGPCRTLSDALAAASTATETGDALPDSICHMGPSLCDDEGHVRELIIRNTAYGAPGLSCPAFSPGFAAFPRLERLGIEGASLGAEAAVVAAALAPADALNWLVLREAGVKGALSCDLLKPQLRVLDLSHNALEGPIPACFLSKPSLGQLYLSGNALSGDMPNIGDNSTLALLAADGQVAINGGTAGFTSLPPNLGSADSLTYLDVSGSRLTKLPALNETMRFLNVSFNNIAGPLPPLPPSITHFDAAANAFTGGLHDTLSDATSLLVYNVSDNPSLGPSKLPKEMGLNQRSFSASNAGLTGPLTEAALPDTLWYLDVSRNKLEGPLPSWWSGGVMLVMADLSSNAFTGNVTATFTKAELLVSLNLSANALTGFEAAAAAGWDTPQLRTLDLSNNALQGPIPARLAQQRRLAHINLSNNKLSSGLDAFAGALAPGQMVGSFFDVSSNRLTGGLPRTLRYLAAFNLAMAPLYPTDEFPMGTRFKTFDVSNNELAGPLPPFLWTELPAAATATCPLDLSEGVSCPYMRVAIGGPKQRLTCPPVPSTPQRAPQYPPEQLVAMQPLLVACTDPATGRQMELMSVVTGRPATLEAAAAGLATALAPQGGGGSAAGGAAGGRGGPRLGAGAIAGIVAAAATVAVAGGAVGFIVGRRHAYAVQLAGGRWERFRDDSTPPGGEMPAAGAAAVAGAGAAGAAASLPGGGGGGRGSPANNGVGTPDLGAALGGSHLV